MSYAVPSLQPIRDEIDREVVINAGWVDVTEQRQKDTEYENTTGRTYEVMMTVGQFDVRLRHPDGTLAMIAHTQTASLCFGIKPGESVEVKAYGDFGPWFNLWFERQL
jgi:Na+-transporting NADH:ubiquinone oxidoreductase subunit NqrF